MVVPSMGVVQRINCFQSRIHSLINVINISQYRDLHLIKEVVEEYMQEFRIKEVDKN